MHTPNTVGVDLYYEERGDGEPLLLLAGAGQSSVTVVDSGLADLFARYFRVVLMDVTGMGRSARVTQVNPAQWTQDVISVLDAAGLERAHLGGSSLGARVAARVAADYPGRVNTLLIDMPITSVDSEQEQALNAFFSGYRTNPLRQTAPRWHGDTWQEAMDFFVTTRQTADFREYYSPASYLASITAPTLICRGDTDHPVHPLAQALEWHRAAQRSWLWIEPGASDMALMKACPERVVDQFVRFITAVGAAATGDEDAGRVRASGRT
jgi:pimeloyl-ACP methyl ester carboxylesterase